MLRGSRGCEAHPRLLSEMPPASLIQTVELATAISPRRWAVRRKYERLGRCREAYNKNATWVVAIANQIVRRRTLLRHVGQNAVAGGETLVTMERLSTRIGSGRDRESLQDYVHEQASINLATSSAFGRPCLMWSASVPPGINFDTTNTFPSSVRPTS